ncbi:MAG: lipase/acyltransferase domain-containing protein, partial [Candidatus Binatia bacterium]
PDDPELDDLGDGITADGLVESHFVVGRFLKAGGYAALLRFFQKDLGLRAGQNLQLFAYDWRRDLKVAARRLATRADGWLRAWQSQSGNDTARIVLVGHAMGGLVGRYYADVEGGWPSVRQIVTLGAPFLGSVRALDLLYFGVDFQSYGLPLHDVTPIARTFTSVYQLLPHYPSIHTFTGEIVSPFDMRIPTFEHQKMERSRQLHRDLGDHHSRNRTIEGYSQLRSTSIAGIGQPTVERARLLANGTLSVDTDPRETEADGDGLVPRFSADASGPGGFNTHSLYVPQSHGMLASDPVVHGHLADLLVERKPGEAPPRTPLPRLTIRRTTGDQHRIDADTIAVTVAKPFYKVGQSIEIR